MTDGTYNLLTPRQKCFWSVIAMIGSLVLLLGLAWLTPAPQGGRAAADAPPAAPDRDLQRMAAVRACEDRVRAGLKAPATARFPGDGADVRDLGGSVAMVISHVDAQNSFGALLRTRWICEVDVADWRAPRIQRVGMEGTQ